MDALLIAMLIGFALAGMLVGWLYFSLMRYSLAYLDREGRRILRFVGFALLRVLLFGAGALAALLVGSWCLVTYLLGFILARTIVLGRVRSASPLSLLTSEGGKRNA